MKRYKYIPSLGVAAYPEKEMLCLEAEARKGWRFVKLTDFCLLKFERAEPQEVKYAVDFFPGKKAEIPEYLELYQGGGWELVSAYHKRYFFFVTEKNEATIFSDEESYRERIKAGWRYQLKISSVVALLGLLVLAVITFVQKMTWAIPDTPLFVLAMVGLIAVMFPFTVLMAMLFDRIRYRKRSQYYNRPKDFAEKQTVGRDMAMTAIIGAVFGFFFGIGFILFFRYIIKIL